MESDISNLFTTCRPGSQLCTESFVGQSEALALERLELMPPDEAATFAEDLGTLLKVPCKTIRLTATDQSI